MLIWVNISTVRTQSFTFKIIFLTACGYEVNPFNKNEYAMSKAEAQAGRFTSKCPAGLHFRVDRCRCDWPQAQPISSSGSSLTCELFQVITSCPKILE